MKKMRLCVSFIVFAFVFQLMSGGVYAESTTQEDSLDHTIYQALINIQPEVNVGRFSTDSNKVFASLKRVLGEHPEIYYFNHENSIFYSNGRFKLGYKYSKSTINEMNKELENKVQHIISETIRPDMSDYEKVKAIHDYIVLNTAYDYENYQKDTVPDSSYNVYGLLINGVAVCDGYAKTMKYLLERVNVDTLYVTGKVDSGLHAWNKVMVNGNWYSLDATWDDPAPNVEGKVRYNYFLIPDQVLAKDHYWNDAQFPDAIVSNYLFMSDMWDFSLVNGVYYYSSNSDNQKIYKISRNGAGKQKIADVRANELVVQGDWIYFSNYSNGGYLYAIKTDGIELTKLNDFHSKNLQMLNMSLQYTNENGTQAYTFDTAGINSPITKIRADMWDFDVANGYYYYSSRSDDIKLYKVKVDGTDKQKINDVRANELLVYGDWIYFSNYSHGGYLFKIRTDGTKLTRLNKTYVKNLKLDGSRILYTDKNESKNYYMKIEK